MLMMVLNFGLKYHYQITRFDKVRFNGYNSNNNLKSLSRSSKYKMYL